MAPLMHTNPAHRAPTWVDDRYMPDVLKQAGSASNLNTISCTTLQITKGFSANSLGSQLGNSHYRGESTEAQEGKWTWPMAPAEPGYQPRAPDSRTWGDSCLVQI